MVTIYTVSFIIAQIVFFVFGYRKGKLDGIEKDSGLFTGITDRLKEKMKDLKL